LAPSFENSIAKTLPIPSVAPVIRIVLLDRSMFRVVKLIHISHLDDLLQEYADHDHDH